MKKLNKLVFAVVIAMFALSASPLMENNNTNVAQAATKRTAHHKKGTKKARYAKIRRRGHVYVTTFSGGYYYKNAALTRHAKKRGYKAGKTLRVKRVVLYHGLQRYQLTNGSYITAYHADFNYHYTYKRVAKKMVNHETIIKARKAKKAKKARKAKKSKKYSKKKKATKKKKANKKQPTNNDTKVLLEGKMTESVKAPTDTNADPYAGKHNNGDVWYQLAANGKKGIVAKFTFENGQWTVSFDAKNNNTVSTQQGKLTKSIKTPTDKDANDLYAGKHHEGDVWYQVSNDGKNTIVAQFTYTNNNWVKNADNNQNSTNNQVNSQNQDDYTLMYGQEMDPSANPISDLDGVDSPAAKLGVVAAMLERHDQGANYIQSTPAPSVDFNSNTITVGNKVYTVNVVNNTVTVDGAVHNFSDYATKPQQSDQSSQQTNQPKKPTTDSSVIDIAKQAGFSFPGSTSGSGSSSTTTTPASGSGSGSSSTTPSSDQPAKGNNDNKQSGNKETDTKSTDNSKDKTAESNKDQSSEDKSKDNKSGNGSTQNDNHQNDNHQNGGQSQGQSQGGNKSNNQNK